MYKIKVVTAPRYWVSSVKAKTPDLSYPNIDKTKIYPPRLFVEPNKRSIFIY